MTTCASIAPTAISSEVSSEEGSWARGFATPSVPITAPSRSIGTASEPSVWAILAFGRILKCGGGVGGVHRCLKYLRSQIAPFETWHIRRLFVRLHGTFCLYCSEAHVTVAKVQLHTCGDRAVHLPCIQMPEFAMTLQDFEIGDIQAVTTVQAKSSQ